MGNYTIFWMFENPRRGRQAENFTTNIPKILDLKSFSEQIFSDNERWVPPFILQQWGILDFSCAVSSFCWPSANIEDSRRTREKTCGSQGNNAASSKHTG